MTGFLSLAMLLLCLVLVVLGLALRRAQRPAAIDRERLNVAIFRERQAELAAELASGRIDQAQHAALLAELQLLLVDDIDLAPPVAGVARGGSPRTVALALLLLIPLLAGGLLAVSGFNGEMRDWLALRAQADKVAALPTFIDEAAAQQAGLSLRDALRLRQAMLRRSAATTAEDWLALGVAWIDAGVPLLAQQSFQAAQRLEPQRSDIALAVVRMDLALGRGQLTEQSRAQLDRILAKEPDNQQALLVYGMAAYESRDYDRAIAHWQHLLALLPPQSEGVPMLNDSIARARAHQKAAAAPGAGIKVRVALAPELGAPPPDAVLFVIVRAAGGAPVPIAAKKLPPVLPADVLISDADQMIPGAPLAQRGPLEVRARLSRSGTPMPASGDLESAPQPVTLPLAAPLTITIDRRVP